METNITDCNDIRLQTAHEHVNRSQLSNLTEYCLRAPWRWS